MAAGAGAGAAGPVQAATPRVFETTPEKVLGVIAAALAAVGAVMLAAYGGGAGESLKLPGAVLLGAFGGGLLLYAEYKREGKELKWVHVNVLTPVGQALSWTGSKIYRYMPVFLGVAAGAFAAGVSVAALHGASSDLIWGISIPAGFVVGGAITKFYWIPHLDAPRPPIYEHTPESRQRDSLEALLWEDRVVAAHPQAGQLLKQHAPGILSGAVTNEAIRAAMGTIPGLTGADVDHLVGVVDTWRSLRVYEELPAAQQPISSENFRAALLRVLQEGGDRNDLGRELAKSHPVSVIERMLNINLGQVLAPTRERWVEGVAARSPREDWKMMVRAMGRELALIGGAQATEEQWQSQFLSEVGLRLAQRLPISDVKRALNGIQPGFGVAWDPIPASQRHLVDEALEKVTLPKGVTGLGHDSIAALRVEYLSRLRSLSGLSLEAARRKFDLKLLGLLVDAQTRWTEEERAQLKAALAQVGREQLLRQGEWPDGVLAELIPDAAGVLGILLR